MCYDTVKALAQQRLPEIARLLALPEMTQGLLAKLSGYQDGLLKMTQAYDNYMNLKQAYDNMTLCEVRYQTMQHH